MGMALCFCSCQTLVEFPVTSGQFCPCGVLNPETEHLSPLWPVPPGEAGKARYCILFYHECRKISYVFHSIFLLAIWSLTLLLLILLSLLFARYTCASLSLHSFLENKFSCICNTPFASFRRVQASGFESFQDRQSSLLSKLSRQLLPPPQSCLPPSDLPFFLLISNLLSAGVHLFFLDILSTQNRHTP